MAQSRREFLRRLGIGAGAALITPALLAQAMQPEPVTTAPAPAVTRPRRPVIKKSTGIVYFNDTPVMEIYDFKLIQTQGMIDVSSKETGYKEYISGPQSYRAVTRGRLIADLPDGTRLIDAMIRREMVAVRVAIHQVDTSFDAVVRSIEFTYPPDFLHVLSELDITGAITITP